MENEQIIATPHIRAKKGDIAKVVLMPGDPLRAKLFAEKYLENDYQKLTDNPELLTNSGFSSADDWKEKGFNKSKTNFEKWCGILLDPLLTEDLKDAKLRDTTFFKNYSTTYAGSVRFDETIDSYVLTVPDGFVYFLGDNRANSTDSSIIGPLETKYMLARVSFITSGNATVWSNFANQVKYLFV